MKTTPIRIGENETLEYKSAIDNNIGVVFDDEDFYAVNSFDGSGYILHMSYNMTR